MLKPGDEAPGSTLDEQGAVLAAWSRISPEGTPKRLREALAS